MLRFRQTGPGLESSVLTRKESSIGALLTAAKIGPQWFRTMNLEVTESMNILNQISGNKDQVVIKWEREK